MSRRSWIVLLAAVLSAAATARLGFWQLDRADQKLTLQAARDAQARLPALSTAGLTTDAGAAAALFHRQVEVDGVWIADATVYLDNRTMTARVGFFVVTPLILDDGRVVAVQRGWLPRDAVERTRIPAYRTDTGRVRVRGRIAPSASRLYELGPAASGAIRQNLDLAEYAREVRRSLLPLVIVQDDAGVHDGLGRQWPQPASDVHKHYGYAFQWFGLSSLVILLYVWFQIIRPRRRAGR